MGLLLVYGLNTWLPKIMGEAGYSIKAGTDPPARAQRRRGDRACWWPAVSADARGNKTIVLLWFGLAAAFLGDAVSIKLEATWLVYAAVLLTGIFVFSAQVLVYAFVGHLYPPEIRGTALGMAAGVGRVGAIVGPSISGAIWSPPASPTRGASTPSRSPPCSPMVALATVPADAPVPVGGR